MKTLNIALVDDSATDLFILSEGFKKYENFKIKLIARNGADFIQKLDAEKPKIDLLLIDLNMPVLNGINTIRLLQNKTIDFKILPMSHGYYHSTLKELQQIGVKQYCQKDIVKIIEIIPKVMIGDSVFNDINPLKNWEEQSKKSGLRFKDEASWREVLTPVHIKMIKQISFGLNSQEISSNLGYEASSIEKYRTNLLRQLGLKNTADLIRWGFVNGVLNIGEASENENPELD